MSKVALDFAEISTRLRGLSLPDDIDLVVGIGSGGVVPAAMAAHQLGCGLQILWLNFRDPKNKPRYEQPRLVEPFHLPEAPQLHLLLVDDVAVTGRTLEAAKKLLVPHRITTLACKGNADMVLFPEIQSCVLWPWKPDTPD